MCAHAINTILQNRSDALLGWTIQASAKQKHIDGSKTLQLQQTIKAVKHATKLTSSSGLR